MSHVVARLSAALVLLVGLLVLGAPAQAHDTIIGSTPQDGATLTTAPTEIVLTFSNELLQVDAAGANTILVTGADGERLTDAAPAVDGVTLTLPLPAEVADGAYDVAWRVVSSDGHPIEGAFAFTVAAGGGVSGSEPGEGAAGTPSAAATDEATATETSSASDDEAAADESTADEASTEDAASSDGPGALIWGVALLAVALAVLTGIVIRSRRR